jgi:hypothetical protein
MWTIWIVSTVIGSAEPKYTRYETFETAMSCHIEQAVLETTFIQDEKAFCTNE